MENPTQTSAAPLIVGKPVVNHVFSDADLAVLLAQAHEHDDLTRRQLARDGWIFDRVLGRRIYSEEALR